jgi:NAD(P)-dependent dehydrogenase (short-subunit alcohol dehydrogenase family)
MNERFNGKVTIVTGAASGIGRAVAERFFKEGASVFAVDRNPETLAKLPPAAERWHPHFCDAAAKGASAPLIEACVARFGGLDVLANIAGVGNSKSAHDTSDEDFEYWINANLSARSGYAGTPCRSCVSGEATSSTWRRAWRSSGWPSRPHTLPPRPVSRDSPAKWPLNTVPGGFE